LQKQSGSKSTSRNINASNFIPFPNHLNKLTKVLHSDSETELILFVIKVTPILDNFPAPNYYTRVSDYLLKNKGKAYSFGIARDYYKKVYMEHHPFKEPAVPGPGAYGARSYMGEDT